jgi:hypothetical protein
MAMDVTIGQVSFGKTPSGYGFAPDSLSNTLVTIQNALNPTGPFASDFIPGRGWIDLGVAGISATRFVFYWMNTATRQYSRWDLNEKGVYLNAILISSQEFYNTEASFGFDLDGDKIIGTPFSGSIVTVGKVSFRRISFRYGFKPNDSSSIVLIQNALNLTGPFASDSTPRQVDRVGCRRSISDSICALLDELKYKAVLEMGFK